MSMTRETLLLLLDHPAVGLDQGGLAQLTGLDRRKVRRLGTTESHHVPPPLSDWLTRRVQRDPTGMNRPAFSAWVTRKPGSDPPPDLTTYRWPAPPPRAERFT
jgi:hypothetical protein